MGAIQCIPHHSTYINVAWSRCFPMYQIVQVLALGASSKGLFYSPN